MSIKNFTEFNLPSNAYTTFEADTLKSLIISRLNENEVFRDQNFEGSNINAFVDIVAYIIDPFWNPAPNVLNFIQPFFSNPPTDWILVFSGLFPFSPFFSCATL